MEPDFEDEFNFKSLSDVKKEFNKNNPQKVSKTKIFNLNISVLYRLRKEF